MSYGRIFRYYRSDYEFLSEHTTHLEATDAKMEEFKKHGFKRKLIIRRKKSEENMFALYRIM